MTEFTTLMKQIRELIVLNSVEGVDAETGFALVSADGLAADIADRILAIAGQPSDTAELNSERDS